MSKSKGGSNRIDFFAMSDDHTVTGTTDTNVIYTCNNVESSAHTAQANGVWDFNIVDQEYNAAYRAFMATALPFDPSVGSTTVDDPELEDGSGGASGGSSVIPTILGIYYGPYDATAGNREVYIGIFKADRSSNDLAATKSSTTNKATLKLIGYKPTANTTVLKELIRAALVDEPVANITLSTSVLADITWRDTP
jgi:hypothetical protein